MKAYISIGLKSRKTLEGEVLAIKETLSNLSIQSFIFVDAHRFHPSQEKEMMQQAMTDIDRCDLFIAEVSEKAIGVGVEAGYAKGKGKSVIYIRNSNAEHSTTISGIADFHIMYSDTDNLKISLKKTIELWISTI